MTVMRSLARLSRSGRRAALIGAGLVGGVSITSLVVAQPASPSPASPAAMVHAPSDLSSFSEWRAPSGFVADGKGSGKTKKHTVLVPAAVIGQTYRVASRKISSLGLLPKKGATIPAAGILPSYIAWTSPAPGTALPEGKDVYLLPAAATTSTTVTPSLTVPNVIAQTVSAAGSLLSNDELVPQVNAAGQYEPGVKVGYVAATQPGAGSTAHKGEVVLIFPDVDNSVTTTRFEPPSVTIPVSVIGQPVSSAVADLDTLGLNVVVGQGQYSAGIVQGFVAATSPQAGSTLFLGQRVTVVPSDGPPQTTTTASGPAP
jgi:beta-lactam-binding protein with PASTA domain